MDEIYKIVVLTFPILIALLAWFLKKTVTGTEKSIESTKSIAIKTRDSFIETSADIKANFNYISKKVDDLESRVEHFSKSIILNIEETRKNYLHKQNSILDSSAKLISQYEELKDEIKKIIPKLDAVEKKSYWAVKEALPAAQKVLKHQQDKINVLEDRIEGIGRIIHINHPDDWKKYFKKNGSEE